MPLACCLLPGDCDDTSPAGGGSPGGCQPVYGLTAVTVTVKLPPGA